MSRITKMVVVRSDKILPSDVMIKIYELRTNAMVKETCFGVMVTGEQEEVDGLIRQVRALDPFGIFVKERAFAPGETFRCRATRGGGPRPGFHNLEREDKRLPGIIEGLKAVERGEIPQARKARKKLKVDKLKEIVQQS